MEDIGKLAQDKLFSDSDLDLDRAAKSLGILLERRTDFGDLFFERAASEGFSLEEGIVNAGSFDIAQGVGVRSVIGGKTGFAYSDVLDAASLDEACRAARTISSANASFKACVTPSLIPHKPLYQSDDPLMAIPRREKIRVLETVDREARAADPRVTRVMASFSCSHRTVIVMDTDGRVSCDIKPSVHLSVSVVLESKGRREDGFAACGGAVMPGRIISDENIARVAREAVHTAALNLEAIPAPAGAMTVVLGAGWPGVLVHEAVGHGLEGDFNRTGSSAFTGLIGKKVASDACTICDDGTIPERRGSLTFDDEGTPTARNVLIENGILRGYMQDRQNAMLMKMKPTGNGRRESYSCLPMPRMTNTFMMPGKYSPEEIIGSVDHGIYATNFKGGQVDITNGNFVFSTSEAYLIEHGKVAAPIKGATLTGNGPDVMKKVSMVGCDLKFDNGIGMCGKAGQSVPVGIGIPTLKIDSITVGGTASGGK